VQASIIMDDLSRCNTTCRGAIKAGQPIRVCNADDYVIFCDQLVHMPFIGLGMRSTLREIGLSGRLLCWRGLGNINGCNEGLAGVEIGEARVLGLEPHSLLFIEPVAEQMQAVAGERDVVRGKREQQALRRSGGRGLRIWFEHEVQQLREGKAELASIERDEVEESRTAFVAESAFRRCFGCSF
jgi:hypothetical protein